MDCDLVAAGNLSLDDVVLPDGEQRHGVIGGDALYGALGAGLWCAKVGILARRAADFPAAELDRCKQKGLDTAGIPLCPGPGLHSRAVYGAGGKRQFTELSPPGTRQRLSPRSTDVPAPYRNARAVFLSALPIENQAELARAFHGWGAAVFLDPYEGDASDHPAAVRAALRWVDVFLPSEEEAVRLLGPLDTEADFAAAARTFAAWGPGAVVLKRGEQGCLLYEKEGDRLSRLPCFPARAVDTTGAGDTFGGGLTAGYLRTGNLVDAALCGTIAASFAVESFGPAALFQADPAAAAARRQIYLETKKKEMVICGQGH